MNLLIALLLAYLAGSIPFGKIVAGRCGIDIQKVGSGNIGFANVLRTLGWKPAWKVLVGDVAKGLLSVIVASRYFDDEKLLLVGLAAIIGHIHPVWLRFRGGKGIATGLGVLLVISPEIAAGACLIYIICFTLLRKSAPSSLLAAASLPLLGLVLDLEIVYFLFLLFLLSVWTHRINIKKMIQVQNIG